MAEPPVAILLGGGGARAAYQVGALRAIAQIHGRRGEIPFPVVCGTSAGAINAVALAQNADDFRRGVARLMRWWRRVAVSKIYRTDFGAVSLHSAQFLAAALTGSHPPEDVSSLLDNAPLGELIGREFRFDRIASHIEHRRLRALAINATSYASGHAVTFFQGARELSAWRRMRRRGEPAELSGAHLLASTAIPFLFPASRINGEYFMDGSVRQLAPLSAPLNLGARRIVVLAVGQFTGQHVTHHEAPPSYPSFAQAAGHALLIIFLDNLAMDVERMVQVNRLMALLPTQSAAPNAVTLGHVDLLVLAPSRDLGAMALEHAHHLPSAMRTLMRALGSTHGTGANLTSYLLFDRGFCRALLDLGYADTMRRRDDVAAFLAGAATPAPLLPPNFG